MFNNYYIVKKEILGEYRNNTSLFIITPTMAVLVLVFPILSDNRYIIDDNFFTITQLLFLIVFATLFSIRNTLSQKKLMMELNFGDIARKDYFISKTISEFVIFLPQAIILISLFSIFTNTGIQNHLIYFGISVIFFSVNSIMINLFFQMFTSFESRFVQFILMVPILMSLSFLVAPIWLGINPNLTNIYLVMYLGITLLVFSFTNWFLQRDFK